VWVNPGDLLHGDRNGVTTIPVKLAGLVAEACPEFMAAESVVLDYLKAGRVTPAGYATARTECQRRIGELAKRVKSLVT
jgi:regulator of RNase E activity RraA